MPPVQANDFSDVEAASDQLKAISMTRKKKLVVFESTFSREKLCVVNMEKIRQNLNSKISQAYDRAVEDESLKKYHVDQVDEPLTVSTDKSGEVVRNKTKSNCKSAFADKIQGDASEEDNSEDCAQMLRQVAEQTFRMTLKKHGYRVSSTNAFLAEGGYGAVFRVHKNNQLYACKVISNMLFQLKSDRGPLNSVKLRSRFVNEVEIMTRVCSHPNIINFVESFSEEVVKKISPDESNADDETGPNCPTESQPVEGGDESNSLVFKNFFLVMEFANSKTLSYYVKNRRSLPESTVKGIFGSLADAAKFMHEQQIAHRDIKLSNLLLQSKPAPNTPRNRRTSITFNYVVKLCDFGLSSIIDSDKCEDSYFLKPVGTSFYMAPELLRSYYFYNCKKIDQIAPYCAFKGDVWALGVCAFYCLHGYYPLDILCKGSKQERLVELEKIFTLSESIPGKTADEIYVNRFRNILRNYNYKLSFNCQELFRRMLEVDAKKRADIFEVTQHAYFK